MGAQRGRPLLSPCKNKPRRAKQSWCDPAGESPEGYSDAPALGTIDLEQSDVFSKIRKDFDAAGVVQSDEQILRVMNELILQAGNQMQAPGGGASDGLAVMLARNLTSK